MGGSLGDGAAGGAADGYGGAKGVVFVGGNLGGVIGAGAGIVVAAVQGDDVTLEVFGEVVILPVGAGIAGILNAKAHGAVALIEEIPQGILFRSRGGEPLLGHGQTVHNVVLGVTAVSVGLPGSQAVYIVLVAVGLSANHNAGQLPSVAPGHGVGLAIVVAQGVAGAVIGNGMSIKLSQQILPVGILIGVAALTSKVGLSIIADSLIGEITGVIVSVNILVVCDAAGAVGILRNFDQLPQGIILIGLAGVVFEIDSLSYLW